MSSLLRREPRDSLDFEIEPGGPLVRDLTTIAECQKVIALLDERRDSMVAQIARAEADPDGVEPGWRTRVGLALHWTKRVRAAVHKQMRLLGEAAGPTADQKRRFMLQIIKEQIGVAEFDRIFEVAKAKRPDLFAEGDAP